MTTSILLLIIVLLCCAILYAHRTHSDALDVLKRKLSRVEQKLGLEPDADEP